MSREQIRQVASRFFNAEISIDERAFQALERVYSGGLPHVKQVWNSLLQVLPSAHILFEVFGIEDFLAETAIHQRLKDDLPVSGSDEYWQKRLQRVFCITDAQNGASYLTEAAETVKDTRILSVESILKGILESGEFRLFTRKALGLPHDPFSRRIKLRVVNPVLALVAQRCGASIDGQWNDQLRLFSSTAIEVFDHLRRSDESLGEQQFILYSDGRKIKIAPFGLFGSYQLSESPLPDGSLWIARSNVLQPTERFTSDALGTLEELINSEANEAEFQKFFECNPEFLLLLGDYARLHSQLVLHEDGGRLVPDFFLEKINSDFCDICDLKRPNAELVRQQRHRNRFRDAVMEAVSQLTYYRDWFEDRARRDLFFSNYGLRAYRPRVVVIIGRQRSYYDDVERIRLESSLPQWVELKTYDDIVTRVRHWRALITT
jgi:hypothetical protein